MGEGFDELGIVVEGFIFDADGLVECGHEGEIASSDAMQDAAGEFGCCGFGDGCLECFREGIGSTLSLKEWGEGFGWGMWGWAA